jgi:hypothetical protein
MYIDGTTDIETYSNTSFDWIIIIIIIITTTTTTVQSSSASSTGNDYFECKFDHVNSGYHMDVTHVDDDDDSDAVDTLHGHMDRIRYIKNILTKIFLLFCCFGPSRGGMYDLSEYGTDDKFWQL